MKRKQRPEAPQQVCGEAQGGSIDRWSLITAWTSLVTAFPPKHPVRMLSLS